MMVNVAPKRWNENLKKKKKHRDPKILREQWKVPPQHLEVMTLSGEEPRVGMMRMHV